MISPRQHIYLFCTTIALYVRSKARCYREVKSLLYVCGHHLLRHQGIQIHKHAQYHQLVKVLILRDGPVLLQQRDTSRFVDFAV